MRIVYCIYIHTHAHKSCTCNSTIFDFNYQTFVLLITKIKFMCLVMSTTRLIFCFDTDLY